MDFYKIRTEEGKDKSTKAPIIEIHPDFTVQRSHDLMVRGRDFYAIWDDEAGLWSTDEYSVQRLVDAELQAFAQKFKDPRVKYLSNFDNGKWAQFRRYLQNLSDNSVDLDNNLTFANTEVKKTDYASRRLPYALEPGDYSAWDELVGTLYSVEERAKIEWAIGAVVSGDAKKIQKFLVLYGLAGTGKSTILNIIQKLFEGYTTMFEAKALGSTNGQFATDVFKHNPLVAIQHDGDLSRIEDNTKLNSIIAHEEMTMNEKFKASYTAKVNAFLFMGTNKPVKISDAKSGIIRRLIDVHPTGVRIPPNHYNTLMQQVDFELGAIAHHCLEVYREMGKNYYNTYRPEQMMLQTDVFYNFIEENYDTFKSQEYTTLKQAYILYKEFCADTGIDKMLPQYKMREELRNYFDEYNDNKLVDGVRMRSVYFGFNANKFKQPAKAANVYSLVMEETTSLLDEVLKDMPAQLSEVDEGTGAVRPKNKWEKVKTTLADIDTSELHYVKVPENHIVIDFDLTDETGEKSLERNLEAASVWPPTYAELSQGGAGVHLHYIYDGEVYELASKYSDGIEVKTLLGDASLRRRFQLGNNIPVATLNTRLPVKEKKVLSEQTIKSEQGLRDLIARNLRKEIHPGTKPSVDFIKKILDDAYESGLSFDVGDLRPKVIAFASNSSNQPLQSLKVVQQMVWQGADDPVESLKEPGADIPQEAEKAKDERLVFYDVEVYSNLFVICWKYEDDPTVVRMINPTPQEVEKLLTYKLVGFNNRRYDNHILYARIQGYDNERLYQLSQKIISGNQGAMFGSAYNLSYADIYDFSSKKQGLKKFEIDLGIHHMEMDIPWDQPVPDDKIDKVVEYCVNDVVATEAVFKSRASDFTARKILAELSGLSVNDTTQKHTARIIFGEDRNPSARFIYTDLSKEFPGYEFDRGKSTYRGEDPSEGGYVYAEPGFYENVAVLDVASMHPTSIIQLNAFGSEYTPKFQALLDARVAIKHGDYDSARSMLGGRLKPFLEKEDDAKELSYALKIVINIVYGLTSAKFDNPFRDLRNKDNIVAKRGALFMIDLKNFVQEELGLQVVHIKTDSIKVPNATGRHIKLIQQFGEKYGYTFEHEATYDKFCLVNDAVYIARARVNKLTPGDGNAVLTVPKWEAVGAQFAHPYIYKTLFTHEKVEMADLCEARSVQQGAMWLDYEHDKPMALVEGMHFVGKTGLFVPVTEDSGGGILYRVKDDKTYAVAGTKGYYWLEYEKFIALQKEGVGVEVDMSYFHKMADKAQETIEKFTPFETLVS